MCTKDFGEGKNRKLYVFKRWGKDKRGTFHSGVTWRHPSACKVPWTCLFVPAGGTLRTNRCIPTPETQLLQDKTIFKNYLFTWLRCVFIDARGFSLVVLRRATLRCGAGASQGGGFSCGGAQALSAWASVVSAGRPFENKGSAVVQGLRCSATRWTLPGPGVELVSAALANGFLSTLPPGKSRVKPTIWNNHCLIDITFLLPFKNIILIFGFFNRYCCYGNYFIS